MVRAARRPPAIRSAVTDWRGYGNQHGRLALGEADQRRDQHQSVRGVIAFTVQRHSKSIRRFKAQESAKPPVTVNTNLSLLGLAHICVW
jgi:hypothetical protein